MYLLKKFWEEVRRKLLAYCVGIRIITIYERGLITSIRSMDTFCISGLTMGPGEDAFLVMVHSLHLHCFLIDLYRPQTKFAKVMFSQVSVCPQGGGCLPLVPGVCGRQHSGRSPWADTPGQTPPWVDSPSRKTFPGQTVNKRTVRIQLECILVHTSVHATFAHVKVSQWFFTICSSYFSRTMF